MWAAEKGNIRAFSHLLTIPGILIWKRDNGTDGGHWKKNAYVYAREYTMYHDEKDRRMMDLLKTNFIKLTGIDSDNDMFNGELAEQIELRPYMKNRVVYAKYPQLDPSYKPPAPPAPKPTPVSAPNPTPVPTPAKTPRVRFAEIVKNNIKTAPQITGNFQSYPYQSGWQTREERAMAKQEFDIDRENMPKGPYSRNNRKNIARRASLNKNKFNKLLVRNSHTRKRSRSKLR
jgi:hypothetical protein